MSEKGGSYRAKSTISEVKKELDKPKLSESITEVKSEPEKMKPEPKPDPIPEKSVEPTPKPKRHYKPRVKRVKVEKPKDTRRKGCFLCEIGDKRHGH